MKPTFFRQDHVLPKSLRALVTAISMACSVLLSTSGHATESAQLSWVTRSGGSGLDTGFGIAAFTDGSTLVTGQFQGTATFGLGEPNETALTTPGSTDVFAAKYDTDGDLTWAIRVGALDVFDWIAITATFTDDKFVVAGNFQGSSTFGLGELNETVLNSAGSPDVFIAKYDSDGTLIWAKRAGGSGFDGAVDVVGLSDGGALVTGTFRVTATFGQGEVNETIFTAGGLNRAFLARYNSDGTLAWAEQIVGSSSAGRGVVVLSDGTALSVGSFIGPATFGSGELNETILNSAGGDDAFLAKYDTDGTLIWAKVAGGSGGGDSALDIAVLAGGSSVVSGVTGGNATFGLGELNETQLSGGGGYDMFVAQFNSDGTLAGAKWGGGSGLDVANGIASFTNGTTIVTGSFEGTATFGIGEANETVLNAAGANDVFVSLYTTDGTLAWAKRAGGSGVDAGIAVTALPGGDAEAVGHFNGLGTFGAGESGQTTLSSSGSHDIFIAKFSLTSGTLSVPAAAAATLAALGIIVALWGVFAARAIMEDPKHAKRLDP